MRFKIALLLAFHTTCQEAVDFSEQSPGEFDTNIAIETVFVKEWSAEQVQDWFDHFQMRSTLDESSMPVHSLFYDRDRAHYNLLFSSACALDTYINEVINYATIFPFIAALIYGNVPSQLSGKIDRIFPHFKIYADENVTQNFFGLPARGVLSSQGPESSEIMVNLAWDYQDAELANDADDKITFLLKYLGRNNIWPEIISNWDVRRDGN